MVVEQVIREYVVENFLFGDGDDIHENDSFLENGIIDSTGIMELVAYVEKKFDFTVPDEELVPENFDSICSLAEYIEGKCNGGRD